MPLMNTEPFGMTLLIDKPLNWTSFDVVNKLRYAVKEQTGKKKNKVGHAGTLDPLATGLLLICIGTHTKKIESMTGLNKTYTGKILIGSTTPSYDLETPINENFPVPAFDPNELKSVANSFLGKTQQLPPIFSAKKINGKKAYELARKGKEVTMKASEIEITQFDIDTENYPEIGFTISCSKGTYIRSIAHDFGQRLNSGGHLTSLRRVKIGPYSIDEALTIEGGLKAIETSHAKYLKDK
ncbi:MAG: tRNA pseudouridine(55) synthase TruB [Salibacteraceae bacterium]